MVAMATRTTSNGSRMNNTTTVDNPGMGRREGREEEREGKRGGGEGGREGEREGGRRGREKRVQVKNKKGES